MDHSPGRREAQDVRDREEQGHDEQIVLGEQVEAHFVRFSFATTGRTRTFARGGNAWNVFYLPTVFYLGKAAIAAKDCVSLRMRLTSH